jgi:hypothetical protein
VSGSGNCPDDPAWSFEQAGDMPVYFLQHQHEPDECAAAFAAWTGFDSPLRHQPAASTCLTGGHAVWWRAHAKNAAAALAMLPPYIAERTTPLEVREIETP